MSDYTIDPTLFLSESPTDPQLVNLLIDLIEQSPTPYLHHGKYSLKIDDKIVSIKLTHPILLRSRENKKEDFRIEVLEKNPFTKGGFSHLHNSLGVLVPERNYVFKTKPVNESRVCKIISITESITKDMVIKEGSYTKMNKLLHSKTPVFDTTYGYLVMRNAGKTDLYYLLDALAKGEITLSIKEKLELTHAILKAVKEQVYDLGLIHNDIKPENILINLETMSVTIIDYAFAHEICKPTTSNIMSGTIEYIAPETLYDNTKTMLSDSFSLGLTIAQIWGDTSTIPITSGNTNEEVYNFHLTRVWENLFEDMSLTDVIKDKITKILDDLTQFNLFHRISVNTALHQWENLLKEYDKSEDSQYEPSASIPKSSLNNSQSKCRHELFSCDCSSASNSDSEEKDSRHLERRNTI